MLRIHKSNLVSDHKASNIKMRTIRYFKARTFPSVGRDRKFNAIKQFYINMFLLYEKWDFSDQVKTREGDMCWPQLLLFFLGASEHHPASAYLTYHQVGIRVKGIPYKNPFLKTRRDALLRHTRTHI